MSDRRVRRTHKALRDALIALTLERGYVSLTVEDIIERADVSRSTFYKHFADKNALLDQIERDLGDELAQRLDPLAPSSSVGFTGKPVREMFRHAEEERDAYRVILRGEGDGRALRKFIEARVKGASSVFRDRAAEHDRQPEIDIDVMARAWVGELIVTLQWWIEQDKPRLSADEVSTMLAQLSLRGRWWASGLDGVPPDDPIE